MVLLKDCANPCPYEQYKNIIAHAIPSKTEMMEERMDNFFDAVNDNLFKDIATFVEKSYKTVVNYIDEKIQNVKNVTS